MPFISQSINQNRVNMIRQDEKEWNTSHERSGQYGFTHPSGCPLGLLHSDSLRSATALGKSLVVIKPILYQNMKILFRVGGCAKSYFSGSYPEEYPSYHIGYRRLKKLVARLGYRKWAIPCPLLLPLGGKELPTFDIRGWQLFFNLRYPM